MDIKYILNQFGINDNPIYVTKITSGHINSTFLAELINRKIVITKTQLRKETVKVEKIEAFGMDFSGKIHVIENAISSKSFIEISYEANNLPEGKQVILGTPISLSKDINDTYVEILVEPEKTQKTLSLASALSVKKIRGAILNG